MNFINVEFLMGHSLGISDSYYKPAEKDVLADYVKSIDALTINKDQKIATQLQKQFTELTERNEYETENLKKQVEELKSNQESIVKAIQDMAKTEEWFMDDPIVTFENTLRRMLGKRNKNGNYNHNLPQIEAAIRRIKEGDKHIEDKLYGPTNTTTTPLKKKKKQQQ